MMLIGCYRKDEVSDPDVYFAAATAVLGDYPEGVMRAACDPRSGLPSRLKWLPTIAEIKEACELEMGPVRRQLERDRVAAQLASALPAPTPGPRPTIAELKAKHGDAWGIKDEEAVRPRSNWVPPSLDDLCAAAGVSRADVDAACDEAARFREASP